MDNYGLEYSLKVKVLVAQSCPTLCEPDHRPPDSSVRGILQATMLKWVAISSSGAPSQPRDRTQVSLTADSLTSEPPGKSLNKA